MTGSTPPRSLEKYRIDRPENNVAPQDYLPALRRHITPIVVVYRRERNEDQEPTGPANLYQNRGFLIVVVITTAIFLAFLFTILVSQIILRDERMKMFSDYTMRLRYTVIGSIPVCMISTIIVRIYDCLFFRHGTRAKVQKRGDTMCDWITYILLNVAVHTLLNMSRWGFQLIFGFILTTYCISSPYAIQPIFFYLSFSMLVVYVTLAIVESIYQCSG